MDAAGLRDCLHVIGWTQRGLAGLVKADSRQVRRWASGDAVVPDYIAEWLEEVAQFHRRHPPPHYPRKARVSPD
jgi:hypothetical protein